MKFRWSLAPSQPLLAGQLASQLNITPLFAQCLINRKLTDPASLAAFLQPRLKHLANPFLLPDMQVAVDRLFRARERREPVVVFGDYDVDGVTSTALLTEVLKALGWTATTYLPNRMKEGYGLTAGAVANCLRASVARVLIAVDCGSTSVETVASLQASGVDVIVLDHHLAPVPARPTALVNPHCNPAAAHGAFVPFTELCSVGIAFKLAHALVKQGRELNLAAALNYDLRPLLDLVALGTIADLVPLRGENRILVAAGLQAIDATRRPGLVALKKVANCPEPIGVSEVGFQLAPRLNAAGRLETAESALKLLFSTDPAEALRMAAEINAQNIERQRMERAIADEAIAGIQATFDPAKHYVIVEGQVPWHVGVVGIVASRVVRQFYRPAIIVGGSGAELRGSGRSIAGFDLAAALVECSDLLVRHGGHAMAAGVSVELGKLDLFRTRLNEIAQRLLKPEALQPELFLDGEVTLDEMTPDCLLQLDDLKPVGQGNAPIAFYASKVTHKRPLQRMGTDKKHVKMWITDGAVTREAVWWGAGGKELPVSGFDLAFMPQVNEYNGARNVQLQVLDWRPHQAPAQPYAIS
jgi:single-stranded-DNA-specific exonuclease